ncbi:nuclear exosome regulator NRDE2-like [Dermatophagoides pteronyssinus]|uniref:Protein NRDE2 homolog n=1 Tax=Dermatophagoides pteronyssinus TaxID=6956 RepID=A0A6P6XL21_DERPT|nr:protein NRDE2 homolog [Dermatophagoides pteronyssinus]
MTTDKNKSDSCLFPSMSSSIDNVDGDDCPAPVVTLFPSVSSSSSATSSVIPKTLPQCSSFPQNIDLIDNDNDDDDPMKSSNDNIIDLSSDDNDSNSSIEFIGEHRDRRRKHSKKKNKHKHRRHEKKKKRKKESEGDQQTYDNSYLSYLPKGSKANFLEDIPNLRSEDAFRFDRNGDRNNLAFDKLYERYVPRYQSKNVIRLYGRQQGEFVDDEREKKKKKIQRYFVGKKKIKSINDGNFIYPKDNLFNQTNIDYIRLIEIDDLLTKTETSNMEQPKIQFESLKDVEQIRQQQQQGPQQAPSIQQLLMEMTRIFNHNLYEDRTSVDKWIDFIHFQDLAYFHGIHSFQDTNVNDNNPDTRTSSMDNEKTSMNHRKRKFCIERKFDICTKALEHNRRSMKLNLLRLKLLSQYSDELQKDCHQIDDEWKNLCFLFPNAPETWFEWLYHSLRSERMMNFKFNRTKKIFKQAFSALSRKQLEGQFRSHQIELNDLETILINITEFMAEFLRSIDQQEKAIGIYQALIEFNLFTPDELDFNVSIDDWIILFEQFWDSGVPRIGEYSATGWQQFQKNVMKKFIDKIQIRDERNLEKFGTEKLMNECEDRIISKLKQSLSNDDRLKSLCWLHMERMRNRLHWLPTNIQMLPANHSIDDIEDPERIVQCDEDLRPFLYRLRNLESKFELSLKFLRFLSISFITNALDSAYSTSRFEMEFSLIRPVDKQYSMETKLFENFRKFDSNRFGNYSELFILKRFELDNNYYCLPLCNDIMNEYEQFSNQSYQTFVDNLFEKLINQFRDEQQQIQLTLLWIQFKRQLFEQKQITLIMFKKFLKEILKKYSNNLKNGLHFYQIYGQFMFEWDINEAIKIYSTTLKLIPSTYAQNRLRLALSFVRMLLNLDSILDQFLTTSGGSSSSSLISSINLLPRSANKSHDFNVNHLEQIALNTLLTVINNDDNTSSTTIQDEQQQRNNNNPALILKTIQMIQSKWIGYDQPKQLEHVQVMIFLLYLSGRQQSYQQFIEQQLQPDIIIEFDHQPYYLISKKNLERSFFIIYLQLLLRDHIINRNQITIRHIRSIVDRAVQIFPDDSLFLAILARLEQRFTVMTKSRKFFHDYVANQAGQLQNYLMKKYLNKIDVGDDDYGHTIESMYNIFMATLHSEFLILDKVTAVADDESGYDYRNGLINRIRNLFERALNYNDNDSDHHNHNGSIDWILGRSLAHCPIIWRLFIRFEEYELRHNQCNDFKFNSAILYRAIQMCPNHKQLYLDCMKLMMNDWKKLVDIMMDQQIRIRTTVEEIDLYLQMMIMAAKNDEKIGESKESEI